MSRRVLRSKRRYDAMSPRESGDNDAMSPRESGDDDDASTISISQLAKLYKERIESMQQQLDVANQTIESQRDENIALRAELNKEIAIGNAFAYANVSLERRIKFLRKK